MLLQNFLVCSHPVSDYEVEKLVGSLAVLQLYLLRFLCYILNIVNFVDNKSPQHHHPAGWCSNAVDSDLGDAVSNWAWLSAALTRVCSSFLYSFQAVFEMVPYNRPWIPLSKSLPIQNSWSCFHPHSVPCNLRINIYCLFMEATFFWDFAPWSHVEIDISEVLTAVVIRVTSVTNSLLWRWRQ